MVRETAWVLHMPASTLIGWNKEFDADMKHLLTSKKKIEKEVVYIILPEEAYLEYRFGNEYRRYKESVRRWL